MKIGFTGAHSTGKTTLLNTLKNNQKFDGFKFCEGVNRMVSAMGFPINEDGNDITQELNVLKHVFNLHMFNDTISDRTLLDVFVYTEWLYKHNRVSKLTRDNVYRVMKKTIHEYDILFYIKPGFGVVDDGVRSKDSRFQNEIADIFEDVINTNEIKTVLLEGDVNQRLEEIYKTLDNYNL